MDLENVCGTWYSVRTVTFCVIVTVSSLYLPRTTRTLMRFSGPDRWRPKEVQSLCLFGI